MDHGSGVTFQNRYPYSTKIICEEHGTTFHRQVLDNKSDPVEAWQCKIYRQKGRKACSAPQIRSLELDQILGEIMKELTKGKNALIDSLVRVVTSVPKDVDYDKIRSRIRDEIDQINIKKDRLLDLSVAGALTTAEFKQRNDALNEQIRNYENQLKTVCEEEEKHSPVALDEAAIRRTLEKELNFDAEINSALVASILDKVVVKKGSTKKEIHLDIYLKLGGQYEAVYAPQKTTASIRSLRNTIHRFQTRRI